MIAFRLADGYVDLSPDATTSLTVTNAFLDKDYLSRVFTFDLTLTRSPHNQRLLHHAYRLDSTGQSTNVDCDCLIDGTFFSRGVLTVESADATGDYKGYFKSASQNILKSLEPKLATFAQETVQLYTEGFIDTSIDWLIYFAEIHSGISYTCSIKIRGTVFTVNDVYFDGGGNGGVDNLAEKAEELAQLIRDAFGDGAADAYGRGQVKLHNFLPSQLVLVKQMDISDQFDRDLYEHKRIAEGVNALVADAESDIVFPVITAPEAYETLTYLGYKAFNHARQDGTILLNEWVTEKNGFKNPLVPMVRVRYILKKIAARLNLTLGGEWWEHPESQRLMLFNSAAIDDVIEQKDFSSSVIVTRWLNKWKKSFVVGDQLPDVSARDFLKALTETFGVYIEVSNGRLLLRRKRDLYNRDIRHWSRLLVANNVSANIGLTAPIKLSMPFPDHTLSPLPTEYAPLSITTKNTDFEADAKDVTLDFNTLLHQTRADAYTPWWHGKTGEKPMTLLFYRGIGRAFDGIARYPYATPDDFKAGPDIEDGDWTLHLTGAKGLVAQHLREWLPFESALEATVGFKTSVYDLADFAAQRYCRIFSATPRGDLHGLVVKINLKIRNNSRALEAATVTLKRIQ